MNPQTIDPISVIEFWYSKEVRPLWFDSTPEFDQLLRDRYLRLYEQALAGDLCQWESSANGILALIIILDQFPLNMFRGDKRSFESEAEAQRLAHLAVEKKYDAQIETGKLAFLYMPLMHSERLQDQDRAVELFEKAGLNDNAKFAHHHRDIIRRFGRFPHRNKILGRENTAQEIEYLNSEQAFLG